MCELVALMKNWICDTNSKYQTISLLFENKISSVQNKQLWLIFIVVISIKNMVIRSGIVDKYTYNKLKIQLYYCIAIFI